MRRKLMKGAAMITAMLLLLSMFASALADTYTSGSFSLPSSRISTEAEETPAAEPVEAEAPDMTEEAEPEQAGEAGQTEEAADVDWSQLDLRVEIVNSLGAHGAAPVGTSVTLYAKLSDDFSKLPAYTLQWQASRDNASWTDIPGATEDTYHTVLPEGNIFWRLMVTVPD